MLEERKLQKAKISLMRDPKFALLSGILMVGKTTIDENIPTAATNGRDERYGRNRVGMRFVLVKDLVCSYSDAYCVAENYRQEGFVALLHETFVTRKNLLSGKEYQERYDTPYFCSPSRESFWSM